MIAKPATERVFEDISNNLDAAAIRVRKIADAFYHALSAMSGAPNAATIEFAVKVQGGGHIFLVSAQADAHVKITMAWHNTRNS